jgi:hypothetical protein
METDPSANGHQNAIIGQENFAAGLPQGIFEKHSIT